MPANHTSTHACASWSVTTHVPSSGVPLVKPTATRAGNPEHPQHPGHRPGEVLAVAGLRLRHERDERSALPSRWRLVVGEAAGLAQPGLDGEHGCVRGPMPAAATRRATPIHGPMPRETRRTTGRRTARERRASRPGSPERGERAPVDLEEARRERTGTSRRRSSESSRSGIRRIAPDAVALTLPDRRAAHAGRHRRAGIPFPGRVRRARPACRRQRGDRPRAHRRESAARSSRPGCVPAGESAAAVAASCASWSTCSSQKRRSNQWFSS